MKTLVVAMMLTLLCGCVSPTPIVTTPAALHCAPDLPASYRTPVKPPSLLPPDATAGDLGHALRDMAADLDTANGKSADLVGMIDSCNARIDETVAKLNPPPWWDKLFAPKPKAPPH